MKMWTLVILAGFCFILTNGNQAETNSPTSQDDLSPPPTPRSDDLPIAMSIFEINEEIEQEQPREVKSSNVCPPMNNCFDNCILGRELDPNGCPMCGLCVTNGLLESDIVVDESNYEETVKRYGGKTCAKSQKGASNNPRMEWPKEGEYVTIPYALNHDVSSRKRSNILKALEVYHSKTCIRFREIGSGGANNYINFVGDDSRGCSSYVGRISRGKQDITIGRNCDRSQGTILHEIMHALGFWHEQSRPDRDEHVQILLQNVQSNAKNNFQKRSFREWDSLGSPYDVTSVMHYGGYFFSNGGRSPTIIDRKTGEPVQSQRNGFSKEDLFQINKKYDCTRYLNGAGGSGGSGSFSTTTVAPTTSTRPPQQRCEDQRSNCEAWRAQGLCRSNGFVRVTCRRTCRLCGGSINPTTRPTSRPTTRPTTLRPTTRPVTRPTTGPGSASCQDTHDSCNYWVSQSFCTENYVSFMKEKCPKACGFCGIGPTTTPPPCTDELKHCKAWARVGLCARGEYVSYMKRNCKLSCSNSGVVGLCGGVSTTTTTTATTTTTQPPCQDNREHCSYWAGLGHCTNGGDYQLYMNKECRRSCGLCRNSVTNLSSESGTNSVASDGECGIPSRGASRESRIVGGDDVEYGAVPWMASIRQGRREMCGGTLINNQYIVTAAHCFYRQNVYIGNVRTMSAYLGKQHRRRQDNGELLVNFESIHRHPRYNHATSDYDIAVIKLSAPVDFSDYIRPACLPRQGERIKEGTEAFVSGWGDQEVYLSESSEALQQVEVETVSKETCNQWLGPHNNFKNEVTSSMFCAGYRTGGKDSCQGDSGGPLTIKKGRKHYLFGVVSWGYGCGDYGRPGVYTKVSSMVNWINRTVRET